MFPSPFSLHCNSSLHPYRKDPDNEADVEPQEKGKGRGKGRGRGKDPRKRKREDELTEEDIEKRDIAKKLRTVEGASKKVLSRQQNAMNGCLTMLRAADTDTEWSWLKVIGTLGVVTVSKIGIRMLIFIIIIIIVLVIVFIILPTVHHPTEG